MHSTPVVTVDGPSGAGKGTLSSLLAKKLGWHFLDSGAIYRVLAVAALHHDLPCDDEECVVPLATGLDVSFETNGDSTRIILEGEDVTDDIRTEEVGAVASKVAALPRVREALLRRQRAFQQDPGLVADGRDMGTVVFPSARLKIFLTASSEVRAKRRHIELQNRGQEVNMRDLIEDIEERDLRDRTRTLSPLIPAEDSVVIDSSTMSLDEVLSFTKKLAKKEFDK